jgi:hypothetical protein
MKRVIVTALILGVVALGYVAAQFERKSQHSAAARAETLSLVAETESYSVESAAWMSLVDAVHEDAFERHYRMFARPRHRARSEFRFDRDGYRSMVLQRISDLAIEQGREDLALELARLRGRS